MASLAGRMKAIDAKIFAAIGETLRVGSERIPGIFNNRYHEIQLPDDTIVGLNITFDCQYSPVIEQLVDGDTVEVLGDRDVSLGIFRFVRRIPPKGDESGKVILELGSV